MPIVPTPPESSCDAPWAPPGAFVAPISAAAPGERVTEFDSLHAAGKITSSWTALLAATPHAQPFAHPGWLGAYWKHYAQGKKLRLLAVQRGADTTGVAPLVVRPEATRVGSLRSLTFPLDNWGTWFGPIGARPSDVWRQIAAHIGQTPRDWDLVDFPWLSDPTDARAALNEAGLPTSASVWNRTALIELHDGWDAYWRSRTSHWRTNVRRSLKKTSEIGAVAFERYRPRGAQAGDADPRWDLYDACEALAKASWQGASTSGTTLSHAAIRDFLRDAHVAAVDAGTLDLALLRVGGRPAAFGYNYHYGGYVFGLRSGFDPALGKAGAGSANMHHMLADSCERGDRLFDLGPNYLEAKRHWHTRLADIFRVTHYSRRSPRAQALRLLHSLRRPGQKNVAATPDGPSD